MATIQALKRAGWNYDWSLDRMFGRGNGWSHSSIAIGVSLTEAIILTIHAGVTT